MLCDANHHVLPHEPLDLIQVMFPPEGSEQKDVKGDRIDDTVHCKFCHELSMTIGRRVDIQPPDDERSQEISEFQ